MNVNSTVKQSANSTETLDVSSAQGRSATSLEPRAVRKYQRGEHTWALVLAAGEGSRLQSLLTQVYGFSIPKQFCSLYSGLSLLEQALGRASTVAFHDRLCTVVAEQHRHWWRVPLSALSSINITIQPENRGTANGILLPLLRILERDPRASIVLLPSDHHVADEPTLSASLRQAVAQLAIHPDEVHLLGIEPDMPDPELGYIVPDHDDGRVSFGVKDFVEKPPVAQARELIGRGSLWNAFILVARAQALLELFVRRVPEIVTEMRAVVRRRAQQRTNHDALVDLYDHLPNIDFSHHIMRGQEAHLRVLTVPSCGWSDLGTPKRIMSVLQHFSRNELGETDTRNSHTACLGAAAQQFARKHASII